MRFYGGSVQHWRHEVSMDDIRLCLRAIPRLRAEEALSDVTRVALGSGRLKAGVSRAILKDWEHRATGGQRRAARGSAARPNPAALRALGIRTETSVKKGATP